MLSSFPAAHFVVQTKCKQSNPVSLGRSPLSKHTALQNGAFSPKPWVLPHDRVLLLPPQPTALPLPALLSSPLACVALGTCFPKDAVFS